MNAFELHPEAEADLDDIIAFIAQDSVDAAGRVLDEFDSVFALLAQRPGMGHRRSDLTRRPLRFWAHRRYLIAYDAETRPLRIVSIIHGMRNPRLIARLITKRS